MMALLLGLAAGLALGLALGWWLSPGRYRHFYRTTQPVRILTKDSRPLCTLPAGTPMVSELELLPASDRAWWAYVPIQFDDMREALDSGIAAGSQEALISGATLHARNEGVAGLGFSFLGCFESGVVAPEASMPPPTR